MKVGQKVLITCIVGIVLLGGLSSTANAFDIKIGVDDEANLHQNVTVPVYITADDQPFGAFEFLIAYDRGQLTSPVVTLGEYFADCGWEYFTYQLFTEDCGDDCPDGHIRIIGQAEILNEEECNQDCLGNADPEEVLFNIEFTPVIEYDHVGAFLPVRFLWQTCDDNVIVDRDGNNLFLSDRLYRCDYFEGEAVYTGIIDGDWDLPSLLGAPDACFSGHDANDVIPGIVFYNGGIYIPEDGANFCGDINLNEVAYEIADAVMYTNYFIVGLRAFGNHVDRSTAASDVNNDGEPLTVADLDYLIRVIIGDALPYPAAPPWAMLNVKAQDYFGEFRVTVETNVDIGAMLLVFDVAGGVASPELHNSMDMIFNYDNGELRVLVYNIGSESIFSGTLLTIPYSGDIHLRGVEAAGFEGYVLHAEHSSLPRIWQVAQNYPNPFNPETTIPIDLIEESAITVEIYNVLGQLIKSFSHSDNAGTVGVVWDGIDSDGNTAATGIYFYKVTIGDRSVTKKMMLWK